LLILIQNNKKKQLFILIHFFYNFLHVCASKQQLETRPFLLNLFVDVKKKQCSYSFATINYFRFCLNKQKKIFVVYSKQNAQSFHSYDQESSSANNTLIYSTKKMVICSSTLCCPIDCIFSFFESIITLVGNNDGSVVIGSSDKDPMGCVVGL